MKARSRLESQVHRFRWLALGTAVVLIIVGLLLLSDLGNPDRVVISEVGLVAGGLYAAYSCGRRALLSVGRRRRAWALLAGAGAVAAAGNLLALGSMLAGGNFSGDLAFAIALLLGIGGLVSFPTVPRRGTELWRMLLDGVVIGGSLLRIVISTVFPQLLSTTNSQIFERLVVIALPMVDVVVATLAALLLVRGSRQDRPTLALVSIGFSLYAVSDLAFAVLSDQAGFGFGTIIDLGWIAGYALIALAAWHPATSAAIRREEVGEASPITGTIVTFGLFLIASVVNLAFARGESISAGMIVLWLVVLLAVIARQVLVIFDLHRLQEGLEQRVSERTSELRELTETSQLMLSSVGEGIYGVDNNGIITFINPSAVAILGYRREELIGKEAHAKFHADQDGGTPYPWKRCYVYEAIADGTAVTSEDDVYVRSNGRRVPVEVTATPLKGVRGEGQLGRGAVVAFRDVTQRREVDRLKNEFVSVVSHELRTPLTAIRGSLGLLSGGAVGQLPASADRMVQVALESSERLTRLINDILDIERIESGTMPMNFGDHVAADLIKSGVAQVRAVADQDTVRLEVGTAQGHVRADSDRVVQTLINLIGNAIKFSPPGGLVTVTAIVDNTDVVFSVADEGRGVPPDKLDRIFGRFEQVDSTDARLSGGTGLGLSISRTLVERQGGRIWVESELGVGSVFHFTLPRVLPPLLGRADDGALVLICDDEPEVVEVLSAILASRGYRTIGVTDGDEAVAVAKNRRPVAVLLDLAMPGVTGADVVDRLRADPRTKEIPIVVISGVEPAFDPKTAARTENWLVKPIDAELLAQTVAATIADHPACAGGGLQPRLKQSGRP